MILLLNTGYNYFKVVVTRIFPVATVFDKVHEAPGFSNTKKLVFRHS